MEYKEPESSQFNTDEMDGFFETCEFLGATLDNTDYAQLAAMFPSDNSGTLFSTTNSPETYYDSHMDYGVGSNPQQDTAEEPESLCETTHSPLPETDYCRCCNQLSDNKRWQPSQVIHFCINSNRGIADILSELDSLRLALYHLSYDVNLMLTEKDGQEKEDNGDKDEKYPKNNAGTEEGEIA